VPPLPTGRCTTLRFDEVASPNSSSLEFYVHVAAYSRRGALVRPARLQSHPLTSFPLTNGGESPPPAVTPEHSAGTNCGGHSTVGRTGSRARVGCRASLI
jgi:hypothetical protein